MSQKSKVVASTLVEGGLYPSEKHTIEASFQNFESLPHKVGDMTTSPVMLCHGHKWCIRVYPGGISEASESSSWVSIFLKCRDDPMRDFTAKYSIRARPNIVVGSPKTTFTSMSHNWGWDKYERREEVLDPSNGYLQNGTLKVSVDIQIFTNTPAVCTWTPRKRLKLDMEALFESGKGDVCFVVGTEKFSVNRSIIACRGPTLGELAEDVPAGTDISIDNVHAPVFRKFLRFLYTDEIEMEADVQAILKVADRFGCTALKLLAESELVQAGVDERNAADLLVFADANSCAYLREVALNVCLAHPIAIKGSDGWTDLCESPTLLAELVGASPVQFSDESYDTMSVASLRMTLDEKGLDVDGTRETLIRRLVDSDPPAENE